MQNMIKEGSNVPRKGHTQKRDVLADPMYNNKVVTKLINNIMLDGKKGIAQKIVYGAFDRVAEKTERPALEVFEEAMNNVMPVLEVKARRIGGATYQVQDTISSEVHLIQQVLLRDVRPVLNTALRDQKTLNKLSAHQ